MQDNKSELLSKYLREEASAEEIALVESWYMQQANDLPNPSTEVDFEDKKQQILSKILAQTTLVERKSLRLWPWAIAAAVLIVAVIGILKWSNKGAGDIDEPRFVIKNDIEPGTHTATLILDDGKKVLLSGNDKQTVTDPQKGASNGQYTLVTARAQNYKLKLPDGSLVWLNAASSIKYPSSFANAKTRTVQLVGEAYFEVAKDKSRPFIVATKLQEIKVTGTHFNVSSYNGDKNVKVTLLEGAVEVFDKSTQRMAKLNAGEQSVFDFKELKVDHVDAELEVAWKDGDFAFQGDNFESALNKISRWYDVDIILEKEVTNAIMPGGWISKSSKLSDVLKLIATTADIGFKIEGRKVTITKK